MCIRSCDAEWQKVVVCAITMHGKHLENKGSKQEQRSSCQQRTFVRASGRRLFLEVLGACVPFGFKKAFPRQQGLNLNLKLLAVLASEPFPVLPGTTPSTKKKEAWTFRSRGAEGGGGHFFSSPCCSFRHVRARLLCCRSLIVFGCCCCCRFYLCPPRRQRRLATIRMCVDAAGGGRDGDGDDDLDDAW